MRGGSEKKKRKRKGGLSVGKMHVGQKERELFLCGEKNH